MAPPRLRWIASTRAITAGAALTLAPGCFVDHGEGTDATDATTDPETTAASTTAGPTGATVDTTGEPETTDEPGTTTAIDDTEGGCDPDAGPCPCEDDSDCPSSQVCLDGACVFQNEAPVCGNGVTEPGEECDDGNFVSGDGCDACVAGGKLSWEYVWGGAAGAADSATDVAIDGAGNIYVVGFAVGDGDPIGWIGKFAPDGEVVWTKSHSFPGGPARGYAITVNADDQPVLAGTRVNVDYELEETWVARRDPISGDVVDSTALPATSNTGNAPRGIVHDPAGGYYLAGSLYFKSSNESDAWLVRLDDGLTEVWTHAFNGDEARDEEALGLALDPSGDVIVCGYFPATSDPEDRDAWVVRVDADELLGWSMLHGDPGSFETANDCALAPGGGLYVAATRSAGAPSPATIDGYDLLRLTTASGDEAAAPLLVDVHDARGVAVDDDGRLIAVGDTAAGNAMGRDLWITKYNPGQTVAWARVRSSEVVGARDGANRVAVDPDGNIVAVGHVAESDGGDQIWVAKYTP
ncbi:MAG: hypothetical protein KC636_04245 [Myxococcales bacterium]|nr:hypothetical protein [Myxococcales bacterium]